MVSDQWFGAVPNQTIVSRAQFFPACTAVHKFPAELP